jgi:perosamine synthetase
MMDYIPVNRPLLNGNEKKYLVECIETGWISSEGPFVEKFEENFAKVVGRKYAVAVSNGTAAIDVAIEALKIKAGDEVILPAFCIISCVLQIVRVGAIPVLVDVDEFNWNMSVNEIESKITSKTKAIMIVHTYGLPVDVDLVLQLAKKHRLYVIEDAAEAHGLKYKDKPCGSFGDVSTFSFYPNKHITTGEGGMLVTNDSEIYEAAKRLRNLCFEPAERFVHYELGWNLRMTNLQAAVGVAQLERLDEFINIKRSIGKKYRENLENLPIRLPQEKTTYADNCYWIFGLVIQNLVSYPKLIIVEELARRNIGTRPFFYPLNKQPVLKKLGLFENEVYPNAEKLYEGGFYIPCGLGITEKEQEYVISNLREIFG